MRGGAKILLLCLVIGPGFAVSDGIDAWAAPVAVAVDPASRPAEAGEQVALALVRPRARREQVRKPERRCTADARHCITLAAYSRDVCRTIASVARENDLDAGFFARLIWQESRFDAGAVSPAGAQGIAQFMPGTAQLRGLRDAFNPAEALSASARYLAEMSRDYGNIGLAAVAYNGGEARADRFIDGAGGLPSETRAYVFIITGHPAEVWRDAPPQETDLSLHPEMDFQTACVARAEQRGIRGFRPAAPPLPPWGVVLASNRSRDGAERQVSRLQNRHGSVLGGEMIAYTQGRRAGLAGQFHYAQIGRDSRGAADELCDRLRRAGGDCMVLRN